MWGRFISLLVCSVVVSCGTAKVRSTAQEGPSAAVSPPHDVGSGEMQGPRVVAVSGDLKEGVCVVRDDFRATCWGGYDGWQDIVEPFIDSNRFRDISVNEAGLCGLFADGSAGCVGSYHGRHGWETVTFRINGPFAGLGQSRNALQLCAIEERAQRPFCWVRGNPILYLVFAATSHRAISGAFGLDTNGKIWTAGPNYGHSEQLDVCRPEPCTNLYAINQGVCGVIADGTATCVSADQSQNDVFQLWEKERYIGACGASRCCQAGKGYVRCREVFSPSWMRAATRPGKPTLMSVGSGGTCVAFESGEVECVNFPDFVAEP